MLKLIQRISRSFVHPAEYFSDETATIWDGVVAVVLLFLASFLQKRVWVEPGNQPLAGLEALKQAAINSLLVWCLFCVFFFAVAGIFRRNVNLPRLSGWVGAAGWPVVFTTLLSAASWWVAGLLNFNTGSVWMIFQNGLSWLGLALGWAGLFGYFLLRYSLKLRSLWAILLPLGAFLLLVMNQLLPLLGSH